MSAKTSEPEKGRTRNDLLPFKLHYQNRLNEEKIAD
jgi:hypothetical protein